MVAQIKVNVNIFNGNKNKKRPLIRSPNIILNTISKLNDRNLIIKTNNIVC